MTSAILLGMGGLGLFLLGRIRMIDSLRALGGSASRRALGRFTRSPFSGAVTGAVTTASLQSSSATTVAAVGFVGAGLLTFPQALGIVFGANVGTTVTGWIVALLGFKLDLGEAVLPLIFGAAMLILLGRPKWAHIGNVVAGFCLVLFGIAVLQDGMQGLQQHVTPETFPGEGLVGRLLLVLIGVVITIVTQSSSAGVAAAMAALGTGAISYGQAAALVIGMDVGTTSTALFATLGAPLAARRTGYAHVIFNLMTAVLALCLLDPFIAGANALDAGILEREPELGLVAFHSCFNLIGTLGVIPFAHRFGRLIIRLVPERGEHISDSLDYHLLRSPELAVSAVGESVRRASRRSFGMLRDLLRNGGRLTRPNELDELEAAVLEIRTYLERITSRSRPEGVEREYTAAVHVLDHLERLLHRTRRVRSLAPDRIGERLAASAARLATGAAELADERTTLEMGEESMRGIWRECEESEESYRKEILEGCASGRTTLEQADDRLAASRWLMRTAFHVWRILVHLRQVPDHEIIPPKREPRSDPGV